MRSLIIVLLLLLLVGNGITRDYGIETPEQLEQYEICCKQCPSPDPKITSIDNKYCLEQCWFKHILKPFWTRHWRY
jgi:hypothetical protein